MTDYVNAKSEFVKKKIKNSKFKDRQYIDDLLFLERSITEGINSWTGSIKFNGLKSSYEKEYHIIFEELKPKGFKKYLKDKKKEEDQEKKDEARWEKEEIEEKRRDKESWIKAGGRV